MMKRLLPRLTLGLLCLFSLPAATQEPFHLDVSRAQLGLRLLQVHDDRRLVIFGAVEPDNQEIWIEIVGRDENVNVRRMRPVYGLWLGYDDVVVRNVPSFYLLTNGRPGVPAAPDRLQTDAPLPWAENLGEGLARAHPQPEFIKPFFQALMDEKRNTQLYSVRPGAVHFIGDRLFRFDIVLPRATPTGTYAVHAWATDKSGVIHHFAQRTFEIRRIGVGQTLWTMARDHTLFYALSLIAIALCLAWFGSRLSFAFFRR